jgi:hypothetical protein
VGVLLELMKIGCRKEVNDGDGSGRSWLAFLPQIVSHLLNLSPAHAVQDPYCVDSNVNFRGRPVLGVISTCFSVASCCSRGKRFEKPDGLAIDEKLE